jgi:hypothetical protein
MNGWRIGSARLLYPIIIVLSCSAVSLAEQKTIGDVAKHAYDQSTLTLPGSTPFHLKAIITEKDSPDSDYQAEVEEYWVAPDKWRRTIKSPAFAQLRVVNGDQVHEENTGYYFPHWLRNFVTALENPLPMLDVVSPASAPVRAGNTNCMRFSTSVGTPPSGNSVFYSICFDKDETLQFVGTPSYSAEFNDYLPFEHKKVARLISTDPEPGTHIEALVTELSKLTSPDEAMFAVGKPTPLEDQIGTITISESAARNMLLGSPEIHWPAVRDGKTKGVLSVLVSADRSGKIREAWGLNSDNPWMTNAARNQLLEWKLKPATTNGVPTQVESILTFAFDTTTENPFPVLTDEEGRKLAINFVEPTFRSGVAPSGTAFVVRVSVDENGNVMGVVNTEKVATSLLLAVNAASRQWKFKPLIRDGNATQFNTDMKFTVR